MAVNNPNPNNSSNAPTTAEVLFWHTVQSAGVGALMTILVGAVQYLSIHGLDLPGLAGTLAAGFGGAMLLFFKSINTPNSVQAAQDYTKQFEAKHAQLVGDVQSLYGHVQALYGQVAQLAQSAPAQASQSAANASVPTQQSFQAPAGQSTLLQASGIPVQQFQWNPSGTGLVPAVQPAQHS